MIRHRLIPLVASLVRGATASAAPAPGGEPPAPTRLVYGGDVLTPTPRRPTEVIAPPVPREKTVLGTVSGEAGAYQLYVPRTFDVLKGSKVLVALAAKPGAPQFVDPCRKAGWATATVSMNGGHAQVALDEIRERLGCVAQDRWLVLTGFSYLGANAGHIAESRAFETGGLITQGISATWNLPTLVPISVVYGDSDYNRKGIEREDLYEKEIGRHTKLLQFPGVHVLAPPQSMAAAIRWMDGAVPKKKWARAERPQLSPREVLSWQVDARNIEKGSIQFTPDLKHYAYIERRPPLSSYQGRVVLDGKLFNLCTSPRFLDWYGSHRKPGGISDDGATIYYGFFDRDQHKVRLCKNSVTYDGIADYQLVFTPQGEPWGVYREKDDGKLLARPLDAPNTAPLTIGPEGVGRDVYSGPDQIAYADGHWYYISLDGVFLDGKVINSSRPPSNGWRMSSSHYQTGTTVSIREHTDPTVSKGAFAYLRVTPSGRSILVYPRDEKGQHFLSIDGRLEGPFDPIRAWQVSERGEFLSVLTRYANLKPGSEVTGDWIRPGKEKVPIGSLGTFEQRGNSLVILDHLSGFNRVVQDGSLVVSYYQGSYTGNQSWLAVSPNGQRFAFCIQHVLEKTSEDVSQRGCAINDESYTSGIYDQMLDMTINDAGRVSFAGLRGKQWAFVSGGRSFPYDDFLGRFSFDDGRALFFFRKGSRVIMHRDF